MSNWKTFLMLFVGSVAANFAHADMNTNLDANMPLNTPGPVESYVTPFLDTCMGNVRFDAGYRRDNQEWKSKTTEYDSLSRSVKFEDIDIFQIGVSGDVSLGYNIYARGAAYWGWVLNGNFKETAKVSGTSTTIGDLSIQNGFAVTANSHNVIDERHVYGIEAALGYPFYFFDCTFTAAPVVGYSYDLQDYWVDDQGLALNSFNFPQVANDGCCKRKYILSWYGPFVGLDLKYRPMNDCWNVFAGFEYHFANFHGKTGHTNFESFDSSRRSIYNAHGWVVNFGADYEVSADWSVGVCVKIRDFYASKHSHSRHLERGYSYNDSYSGSDYYKSGVDIGGNGKRTNDWTSYFVGLTAEHSF